jgi:hypothetical protein
MRDSQDSGGVTLMASTSCKSIHISSLYSLSLESFITIIMRLPYIPDPPEFTEEADKAVLERIKERRGPKGLIALDRTLLHSPPVADGW